jgi:4-amino-4-deoxy-L-arabinose transferase-like glycosyltransferase
MTQDTKERAQTTLVLLCAALVLFPTLGMGSIFSSDDAIYAQMAREMVSSGSWLEPAWLGVPIFDKPPLLFWLLGLFGSVFGFDEFILRLPGALGALVSIYYVVKLVDHTAETTESQREPLRRWVALGLTLASVTFVMNVRRPMADPLLIAAMLAHLTYGLQAAHDEPGAAIKSGIALGIGLLAKWVAVGPVALVVGVGWLVRRRLVALLTSSAAALIVAGPWHLWMSARHGADFWNTYLGYHVIGRASSALVGEDDALYYVRVLAEQDGLIASVMALGIMMACLRLVLRPRPFSRDLLALAWVVAAILVTLATLHLASTRLFHYLLPVMPLAAVATVASVDRMPQPILAYRILGSIALLGFLIGPLYPHLLAPDYGSRSANLVERHLKSMPEEARLVLWEDYDPATIWYVGRPAAFYSADERFYSAQMSVDMMRRSGAVVWADESARDALIMEDAPVYFVAPLERSALLVSWSEYASLSRIVRFVRDPEIDRMVAIWGPKR